MVKNPPAMQEIKEAKVLFLGWEDLLEEEMATCSSILAWRIPWTEEPGGLQSMGSQRVRHIQSGKGGDAERREGQPRNTSVASVQGPAPRGLLSSIQSLSHAQLFATSWTAAHQASLSITNSRSLLKLMSITTRNCVFEFF